MLNSMGAVIFLYIKLSGDIAENEFNEISAPIADKVYLKISIKKYFVYIAFDLIFPLTYIC